MSPLLDHQFGLLERVEDFTVEQLVSELGMEAFVEAILPGAARWRREDTPVVMRSCPAERPLKYPGRPTKSGIRPALREI